MKGTILGLSLCIALAGARAFAEDAPAKKENDAWSADARTIVHIQEIVKDTAGSDGVFVVRDNGEIAHVQSGLVCPPKFPNVDFWHAEIFSSPLGNGMDIGCDYGRGNPNGKAISKLTIFETKAPDGLTLDQAFQQDRADVMKTYPDAISQGTALKIENKSAHPSNALPEIRSEEFLLTIDGHKFTSQLLVTVHDGWVLEIRASFLGTGNNIDLPKGATPNDIMLAVGDRAMLPAAFVRVAGAFRN